MTKMVKSPTRGSNILDVLFCASESHVTNVDVGEPLQTSDHNYWRFKLKFELKASIHDKIPNSGLVTFNGLRESMASADTSFGHNILTAFKILSIIISRENTGE